LVFVTKYRHRVFNDAHLERMEEIMRAVCADFECELVEFNREQPRPPPRELPAQGRPVQAGQLLEGR
jgi:hypothetical protein